MNFNDDDLARDNNSQQQTENNAKPSATRVDNGAGLDQEDLEKTFLFGRGDDPSNPTEGRGEGGQNFGEASITPASNDRNNPSQMAGDTNAYLGRKEPLEEHPEDTNFSAEENAGTPDYDAAHTNESSEPKPEQPMRGDGENDRPHEQETYQEGTADNDGETSREPNVPGYNELPDQQKVGEDSDDDERDHIET